MKTKTNNLDKRAKLFDYSDGDQFAGKNTKVIFTEIMEKNFWNNRDSISGIGSTNKQTAEIIKKLPEIFTQFEITSIFDIPCGDFNWMKKINLSNIKYLGGDIVNKIIEDNIKNYKNGNIDFTQFDIIENRIKKYDLIFCRDCLVHFSFQDIFKTLENIKNSQSKYFMTTTFSEQKKNENIQTGGWRPLNLTIEPFNFPKPLFLLNENCTEQNGIFKDKSLGLWEISKINISFLNKQSCYSIVLEKKTLVVEFLPQEFLA